MGVHSTRAKIIDRRTYIRPLDERGETFETKAQAIQRAIDHQEYLWTQALENKFKYLKDEAAELQAQALDIWDGAAIAALEDAAAEKIAEFIAKTRLSNAEKVELENLRTLFAARLTSLSGRVKWMAGTDVIRERPSAAFNCSFSNIKLPADVVDAFWLLLQGCGVGFRPIPGMLTGFPRELKIEHVPSTRTERGGREKTISTIKDGVWTIVFGDSAKGWAKGVGKMLAKKPGNVHTLRLDYSQLRPGGLRLRGYGWISSGWEPLMRGLQIIVNVLNRRAGETLDSIDIGDIINALGTVLSSRRSAQIWLCDSDSPDLEAFITAKDNYFERGLYWRAQSNNSIAFKAKPTREFLRKTFDSIMTSGEPGLYNLEAARRRAPWAEGTNPCLTGDTLVSTTAGLLRLGDTPTCSIFDANGREVPVTFRKTGENQSLLKITLSDGSIYRATPYHNFVVEGGEKVPAHLLKKGMSLKVASIEGRFGDEHAPVRAYTDAWLIADGTWSGIGAEHSSKLDLYAPKFDHIPELEAAGFKFTGGSLDGKRVTAFRTDYPLPDKTRVPAYVLRGDKETVSRFIEGYMQSDGHIGHTSKGWTIQVTSVHQSFLQDFQAILRLYGVRSKIALARAAGARLLPDGQGGNKLYECQDCWRLTVSNTAKYFEAFDSEKLVRGPYNKEEKIFVESVEALDYVEDVYCTTVSTTGSFDLSSVHSGNCAEIILPDKGFCVSGDTDLITATGIIKISEAEGVEIEIWNGERFSRVTPFKTGDAVTLFEVKLNDGSVLRASANHRFQVFVKHKSDAWEDAVQHQVTTLDLMTLLSDTSKAVRMPDFTIGAEYGSEHQFDAYTTGVYFGDGSQEDSNHAYVDLYSDKISLPVKGSRQPATRSTKNGETYQRVNMLAIAPELRQTIKTDISPVFGWTKEQRLQFLAGAFDTDGSETGTGGLRLYVSGRRLGEQFQLLLRTVGVRASLNLMAPKGAVTNFGARSEDIWYVQVTDGCVLPTHRLDASMGHETTRKGRYQLVQSVKRLEGLHPTYCLTEPDRGMAVFGNMLTYQCNLVQIVFHRYNGRWDDLKRDVALMARANYRQTLVSMRDGVLQVAWDDNNKLLRLCGVSPLGWVGWEYATDPEKTQEIAQVAIDAANGMADELGEARPALVTQVQPGGTSSKVLGEDGDEVFEGVHLPLGRFIFNNVGFSKHDPIVQKCLDAGYHVEVNPYDAEGVLIRLPAEYPEGPWFTKFERDGEILEINVESAVAQLDRYKFLMDHYVDHNCSVTISYDNTEADAIVDWLLENWDSYIGVSFIKRNDPTKTAADLGHAYLPQQVVTEADYRDYVARLGDVSIDDDTSLDLVNDPSCATGACPVR